MIKVTAPITIIGGGCLIACINFFSASWIPILLREKETTYCSFLFSLLLIFYIFSVHLKYGSSHKLEQYTFIIASAAHHREATASTVSSNDNPRAKRKFELLLPLTYDSENSVIRFIPTISCKLHMATNVMSLENR